MNENELVIRDVCARLPYGVKVSVKGGADSSGYDTTFTSDLIYLVGLREIKPYLRPMSSMTDTERADWLRYCGAEYDCEFHTEPTVSADKAHLSADWLNEHHFDYRGLIKKGLALEAHEGMYDTKTE